MSQIEEKIKYFEDKLKAVKDAEKQTVFVTGQFNDEFMPWLKGVLGGIENFSLVDVLRRGYEIGKSEK